MVPDIGNDIQPQPAVGGDGVVKRGVEARHKGLDVGALPAGAQADARTQPRRRDLRIGVDAEIDPNAVEHLLNGGGDARFSGSRRAVEDDDLSSSHAPKQLHEKWLPSGIA